MNIGMSTEAPTPPTAGEIRDAWCGATGEDWAKRNPLAATDTDASYGVRYATTKTDVLRSVADPLPVDASFLDVGCSRGAHAVTLAGLGFTDFVGVDLNLGALRSSAYRWRVAADATCLPFGADAFDVATTSGGLMHVTPDDLPETIRGLARIARRWLLICEQWYPVSLMLDYGDLMPMSWIHRWEDVLRAFLPDWVLRRHALLEPTEPRYQRMFFGLYEAIA